ncbi:hypothetical protein [Streptomyces sp. NPDC086519]|uniref:hypothetical protein n=1 Tax=Streptomyces sp. NPDC086519 TaxID=3154863 RepID=UPI003418BFB3
MCKFVAARHDPLSQPAGVDDPEARQHMAGRDSRGVPAQVPGGRSRIAWQRLSVYGG